MPRRLQELREAADNAAKAFDDACRPHYCDGRWGYYRAVECDRAVPKALHCAADAYLAAVHAFYLARDGGKGWLGKRGL